MNMEELITSYILQSDASALPGIGSFSIVTKPAELDIINKKMLPAGTAYSFDENIQQAHDALTTYIALKKNIDLQLAEEQLNVYCNALKRSLEAGNMVCFQSIGCLQKNETGNLLFTNEEIAEFLVPVLAEKVLHQNVSHALLVGDKETTTTEMNEYYSARAAVEKKSCWLYIALILFIIGIAILVFRFYIQSPSPVSAGNQIHFSISAPDRSYFKPE